MRKERCSACGKMSDRCRREVDAKLVCPNCWEPAHTRGYGTVRSEPGVQLNTLWTMVIEIPRGPHIGRTQAVELMTNGSCSD